MPWVKRTQGKCRFERKVFPYVEKVCTYTSALCTYMQRYVYIYIYIYIQANISIHIKTEKGEFATTWGWLVQRISLNFSRPAI